MHTYYFISSCICQLPLSSFSQQLIAAAEPAPVEGRAVLCSDSSTACQPATATARLNPLYRQRLGEQMQFVLIYCLLTFLITNAEILAPCRAQSLLGELLIPPSRFQAAMRADPLTAGKCFLCASGSTLSCFLLCNTTGHPRSSKAFVNTPMGKFGLRCRAR